ncbi:hypothetical protein K438DRAFT_2090107 [Mycena galopus ATCC 62051]|nr:hypothetical protein K438DRAFT_2090107 [Mycena galopus ATCC 62051]
MTRREHARVTLHITCAWDGVHMGDRLTQWPKVGQGGLRLGGADYSGTERAWKKNTAEALTQLYRTAKSEQCSKTASFEVLNKFQKGQHAEAVAVWETKDENPKHNSNDVWSSVFQINMKSGPPTHAAAYTKLLAKEAEATQSGESTAGGGRPGNVSLMSATLLVERDRERLKRLRALPTSTEELLALARQQLQSDIKALRKWQLDHVPELHKYMKEINVDEPEKIRLLLPSDFSPADRVRFNLSESGYSDDQGWRAYAHRQAAIYVNLARKCETLWKKLPQLVINDEIADAKKAKKEEEEQERNAKEEPDYEPAAAEEVWVQEDYLAEVL